MLALIFLDLVALPRFVWLTLTTPCADYASIFDLQETASARFFRIHALNQKNHNQLHQKIFIPKA
jgi:hypothetical protein